MAYYQATNAQLTTKELDEQTFCNKMKASGYICERCTIQEDKDGKDFKYKKEGDKDWTYVDVKGFKSFRRIFGLDKKHTFIEVYYDIESMPPKEGWVCHPWYTAFKIDDDYKFALVENKKIQKLLKEKVRTELSGKKLDDVASQSDIRTYYPYLRKSEEGYHKKITSVLYWVPLEDIINLEDTVLI